MTQDEIIELAQKCGLIGMRPHLDGIYSEALEAFAKLVADKAFQNGYEKGIAAFNDAVLMEREACAQLCEEWLGPIKDREMHIAKAIRARGKINESKTSIYRPNDGQRVCGI